MFLPTVTKPIATQEPEKSMNENLLLVRPAVDPARAVVQLLVNPQSAPGRNVCPFYSTEDYSLTDRVPIS